LIGIFICRATGKLVYRLQPIRGILSMAASARGGAQFLRKGIFYEFEKDQINLIISNFTCLDIMLLLKAEFDLFRQ